MSGYWGRIGRPRQILTGVSIILAACLWFSLQASQHRFLGQAGTAPNTPETSSIDNSEIFKRGQSPALETLSAIDDRPLFSPSRRPVGSQSRSAEDSKTTFIGTYLLQGIVIGEVRRLALLVDPATKKTLRLAEGESIDTWTAIEIGEDFVRFEAQGTERIIRLAKPGKEPSD